MLLIFSKVNQLLKGLSLVKFHRLILKFTHKGKRPELTKKIWKERSMKITYTISSSQRSPNLINTARITASGRQEASPKQTLTPGPLTFLTKAPMKFKEKKG